MYKVIICSYKEPKELLNKCLEHIRAEGGTPIVVEGLQPVGKARNAGLNQTEDDDYLFFVDVDQHVQPNYFRLMIDAFRKCDPKVGGIWALNAPPKNATILQKLEQGLLNYTQRKSIGQNVTSIGCGGSCFKREAIQGLRFDESVVAGEDALFCKELTKKGWKLRIAPIEIEHVKPRGFRDWTKSEFYGGVGYVQVGGSLVYSIKRLLGSPFRGLQLSLHYHNPLFFFYYPFRLLIWFSGILKAFLTFTKAP